VVDKLQPDKQYEI